MLGALVAVDLFLFFLFWELMLFPMFFVIGVWGGPRRRYATIKFMLFTMAGSALMLVGDDLPGPRATRRRGPLTFDIVTLYRRQADRRRAGAAVRRLHPGVHDQGADGAAAHLAARRAHRGADRRLGRPRRRAAQDGRLRLPALLAADVPARRRAGLPGDHDAWPWSASSTAPWWRSCSPT